MSRSRFLVAVIAGAVAGGALAAAPDVRTGLWERTETRQMVGVPVAPVADVTKLPPEQRARIEQMLATPRTTPPSTSIVRYCVTPESAQNWNAFAADEPAAPGCERTVQNESSSAVKISIVCGGGKRTGTIEFSAAGPDRVAGTVTTVLREDHGERTIRVDMNSRWLSPDCGEVKPGAPARVKG